MNKISIKKPNLIAIVVASYLCGYFPDLTRFERHFSISGLSTVIIKSQGWRLNSQVPPIWVKYSWIKCSHGQNSTSESIDKDWTSISTHYQSNSSPVSNVRLWILQQNSSRRRCFITKVATASTVDNKLTLTGVADRSLSTANFFIPLALSTLNTISRFWLVDDEWLNRL